jgi:AcrR family transcriptional regulator
MTREERRQRTREELVAAARRVFTREGFHGASLDQIADEAGYTKGAVYSNFAGKDELFLAVLDDHLARRASTYADAALDGTRIEDSYRAVAAAMTRLEQDEPEWTPLLVEFWAYASRRDDLRAAVSARRERFLDVIAGLIDELSRRYGVRYAIPAREVARGSAALARGIALERLLAPGRLSLELFERMHTAYMRGLERDP